MLECGPFVIPVKERRKKDDRFFPHCVCIPWFRFAYELDVGRIGRQTTVGRVGIDVDGFARFSVVVKRSANYQIGPAGEKEKDNQIKQNKTRKWYTNQPTRCTSNLDVASHPQFSEAQPKSALVPLHKRIDCTYTFSLSFSSSTCLRERKMGKGGRLDVRKVPRCCLLHRNLPMKRGTRNLLLVDWNLKLCKATDDLRSCHQRTRFRLTVHPLWYYFPTRLSKNYLKLMK